MNKKVSEKMGIKEKARNILINAPEDAVKDIELPLVELEKDLKGEFDYIHFFAVSQKEFHDEFPALKKHLKRQVRFGFPGSNPGKIIPTLI